MDHFHYQNGELYCENVAIRDIAEAHGTPTYVYSRATLERHWKAFDEALASRPHLVCYAVKANSNLAVLNVLARLGSGFDIVSGGELERVLAAGGDAGKVVFSGVGKSVAEIRRALEVGIRCFNVESIPELDRINEVAAAMGKKAPVSLRVNPDVDAQTHPYISTGLKENKFGIDINVAVETYKTAKAMSHLDVIGIDCHIGSQLTQISPFVDALKRVLALVDELAKAGIHIHHLDLGGGLGIRYNQETPPQPAELIAALNDVLGDREFEILVEPGRAIVGNAGILVSKVELLKHTDHKDFAIIDAAMNDLMRPALYSAWQEIVAVVPKQGKPRVYDIVGPVCETGDFLGKNRELYLEQGDLVAIRSSGAYGFSMSSNYNSRPRAAEILIDGHTSHVARERETFDHLIKGEHILP